MPRSSARHEVSRPACGEEDVVMRMLKLTAVAMTMMAGLTRVGAAQTRPTTHVRHERRDLRQDQRDLTRDRKDARVDTRELNADKREVRQDIRDGEFREARRDERDVKS